MPTLSRRDFLSASAMAGACALASTACKHPLPVAGAGAGAAAGAKPSHRFFFTSQGKTGLVNSDGTGLRFLEFNVPNQATWQPGPFFSDGRRVLMLSMEPRRDGPGRPFEEYYTQTPTHLWDYHLDTGRLVELATQERMAVFYSPALLLNDTRMLVQVVRNKVGQIFSMNLDGTDARPFTQAGEGLPYGISSSPDGKRVAFHLASPRGYEIWTCNQDGTNRLKIVGHPDHLYFGTSWSPDGRWILYQDCLYKNDPGHDWSDVCVGRSDGSEHRVITQGQSAWFAATYGNATNRGGGSNMPVWTRDGSILFSRRLPGSKVAWEYQAQRPDTDHFNRDFKPESARGGSQACLLNPVTGTMRALTSPGEGVWDFRVSESSDGKEMVFCRAKTGGLPEIWVQDLKTARERLVTRGLNDLGADHPRWLPVGK